MGKSEKRMRKKDARDAALAQRRAELRRRTIARLIGVGVVLAIVIGFAFFSGDDDSDPAADETPEPTSQDIAACGAQPPPATEPQQYDSPPDLTLPEGVDYRAVVHTSCGDIEMDLLEESAPKAVANFVFLAQEGYFDGLIFHRVEANAVIQTGDPNGFNGQPPDGPGYSIEEEPPRNSQAYVYGVAGMANTGQPNSTGSQWFIVTHKGGPAGYDPLYSVFAVVDGSEDEAVTTPSEETLDEIDSQETDVSNPDPAEAVKPLVPVYIESIEITEA